MNELLNLLKHITPEQRAELSHQLHVVRQVCLAEQAYQGAPMAHLEDRQKAAAYLENYVSLLKAANATEAKAEKVHEVAKLFSALASKEEQLRNYKIQEDLKKSKYYYPAANDVRVHSLYFVQGHDEITTVREKFVKLIGENPTTEEVETLVSQLNQTGLFELVVVKDKTIYPSLIASVSMMFGNDKDKWAFPIHDAWKKNVSH